MQIRSFELPPIGTNAILIDNGSHAVLFDAPATAWQTVLPILEAEKLTLDALVLTHGHWDHMIDTATFKGAGIPVWAHEADREWIEDPMRQAAFLPPGYEIPPAKVDRFLAAGEKVQLLGQEAEIRHVPGHSPGNIAIYFPEEECCVVGDAIFAGSVGRPDLPGGDWPTLERSIKTQLYTLPDATILYPGHGPITSVGQEKKTNPYVRG